MGKTKDKKKALIIPLSKIPEYCCVNCDSSLIYLETEMNEYTTINGKREYCNCYYNLRSFCPKCKIEVPVQTSLDDFQDTQECIENVFGKSEIAAVSKEDTTNDI